jgi:hypothetical protein
MLFVVAFGVPLVAAGQAQVDHSSHATPPPDSFVEQVRRATEPFRDARNVPADMAARSAVSADRIRARWAFTFVNGNLLGDDVLDPTQPEALIYEFHEGVGRLVGVEYIVFYDVWHLTHSKNDPPQIAGQLLNFYEEPNRFGLPPFYELHVWAWRDNPNGSFVDWNPAGVVRRAVNASAFTLSKREVRLLDNRERVASCL